MTFYAITFSSYDEQHRRSTGTYEMDCDRMNHSNVATDILQGQFVSVDRVYTFSPADHTCEDVTADIAKDIAYQLSEMGQPCPEFLRDWMHVHYGVIATMRIDYNATGEVAYV